MDNSYTYYVERYYLWPHTNSQIFDMYSSRYIIIVVSFTRTANALELLLN